MSTVIASLVTGVTPKPFAYEAEMAEPVSRWLLGLPNVAAVAHEVNAGNGIADFVAGHVVPGAGAWGTLPLRPLVSDETALRLLEFTQRERTESVLRSWAPHGWRGLRCRVVAPLIEAGHLVRNDPVGPGDEATYVATFDVTDPFSCLTAVEMKLRDWRRGLAQAGRYRLFAERSYLALPADVMHGRAVDEIRTEAARNRVGVLAVQASGEVTEVAASEALTPLQPQRRRWGSEQLLSAARSPSKRPAGSPIR